jgi:hypothetical protein
MRGAILLLTTLCVGGCSMARFKFQTAGQDLDSVAVYNYTIQGLVLKPPTPSDAKIFRDAQNNALIQWKRRGRINHHWRDRAGVPVSEENEYYEIEVLNGSTVVRTVRVPVGQAQPIQWTLLQDDQGDAANFTISPDGSGTIYKTNSSIFPTATLWGSKQLIQGDFVFEFETFNDGSQTFLTPDVVNLRVAADPIVGPELARWQTFSTLSPATIVPSAQSGTGPSSVFVAGDRFAMEYRQGVMRFFKNPTSDMSAPVFAATVTQAYAPYRVSILCNHTPSGIRNPALLRFDTPDWTYTADMQTADGLTPGNAIHLHLFQVSAQTGRGVPLDFTG